MFTLHSSYCSQGLLSQERNGHARLCSCRKQFFGDFGKDIHHTYQTKPFNSRKHFQQCSHSSSPDCTEHKLCLYWFFLLKTHSGINNLISHKLEYSGGGTANCRFWYCWQLSSICDYHESDELSGWYSLNPHWCFQRSVCAGVWLDFNARRYWKLPLSWACWRTTKTGAKFYPSAWKPYWTHCIEWTNVVGCNWQVWCCWKDCVKLDNSALQRFIYRIPLLSFRYLGLFPSDFIPTLDNDTFAFINTQPSYM